MKDVGNKITQVEPFQYNWNIPTYFPNKLLESNTLGGIGGKRRRGRQRMRWLACCDSWGHKESDTTELLI